MALQKIFLGTTTGDKTGTGAKAAGAIINSNFQYLENKVTNRDRVVIDNGFLQVADTLAITSGWQWFLDSLLYTNPVDVTVNFPLSSAGLRRIDHVVATTSNTFMRVPGLESEVPVAPLFTEGTIVIAFLVITDSGIEELVFLNDISNKLDKGNYSGTAQDLDIEIQNLKNPDIVLKNVTPTIAGLNISAPADSFEWRINQEVFDNTPALVKTLTAASDGFYRKDALLGTNTNTYIVIEGVEGDESVTPPTVFPTGTILLGVIDVFGATVGGFSVNDTSRTYVYGNGGETDYVQVNKLGTTLEIKQATSITGFTIPAVNLQYGKDYYLRNSTGNILTLKSAIGTNNIRFYFPDGDFIVPVNNTIHLKYLINGEFGGLGYFTLVGLSIKGKADTTYVDSQDFFKEDKNNKTSTLSGKEGSNVWFPSANGITAWIKYFLSNWIGAHATETQDADTFLIGKSGVLGTRTWLQLKTLLLTYFETKFAVPQITLTTTVNITTDTLDASGYSQKGRNAIIKNGVNPINITVNGGVGFVSSYLKDGTGAITFVQGVGRVLVKIDGTNVLNGAVGSTATISSEGTKDYLRISNA